jgi:hypothetical protein
MTNEQINIAIAEALGKAVEWHDEAPYWLGMWSSVGEGNESFAEFNPAYDLNAMHEAEKVLTTTEQQNNYYAEIAEITWGCEEIGHRQIVFNQLTATARQRAEAFLRTLGKWEE